jgi:hypothetical protein
MTIVELKKHEGRIAKAAETPGSTLWLSDTLPEMLHSLPDIVDEKNKAIKITAANLERLDAFVLQAIHKAIADDMVPKTTPSS